MEQILGVKAKAPPGGVSTLIGAPPAKTGWVRRLAMGLAALLVAAALGGAAWYWLGQDQKEVIIGPKGRAVPQAFCADLKNVVAAADSKFTAILGPQYSGIWTARIQLPGWEDCTVRDWTFEGTIRRYYSCELRSFTNIAEMDTMLTALQTYMH
jgi:hypothetical protein